MAEEYSFGVNRIFYRSTGFQEGLQVTVDLLCSNLDNHTNIVLVENGGGIYYFDYDFNYLGVWHGTFCENGVKVASQNFKIKNSSSGRSFGSSGSSRLINR